MTYIETCPKCGVVCMTDAAGNHYCLCGNFIQRQMPKPQYNCFPPFLLKDLKYDMPMGNPADEVIVDDEIHFRDLGHPVQPARPVVYYNGSFAPKKRMGENGDACYDIYADEDVEIFPFSSVLVKTGLYVELPPFHHIILKDKSGVANSNVYTAAGVVDCGYRGELLVDMRYTPFDILFFEYDHYKEFGVVKYDQSKFSPYRITRGQKICQALVVKLEDVDFKYKNREELSSTDRGDKGYGSTGMYAKPD